MILLFLARWAIYQKARWTVAPVEFALTPTKGGGKPAILLFPLVDILVFFVVKRKMMIVNLFALLSAIN
ncbi:MAG: hypothetical protein LBK82_02555 [Planctomycetaceae bacterium]|nr:hypothetical protein [Planctomycetaceae bacterium]